VTELEAFLLTPASEAEQKTTSRTQRITTDVRVQLLRDKGFFYEFSYNARDVQDRPLIWSMSNGLSFSERLNPTFTVSARASRLDETDINEQLTSYYYGASLRAQAIPTLSSTVVFSGRWNDVPVGYDYANSVYLYNGLTIYRGLTLNLGMGTTASVVPDGQRTKTFQVNATANVVPHRTLAFNLQYQQNREERTGGALPGPVDSTQGVSTISASYTPLPAIYLYGSYRIEQQTGGADLTTRSYSMSWNPFAGGGLQLSFQYNETYRNQLSSLFRFFTTRARWNITQRWYVELAWEKSMSESDLVTTDLDTLKFGTRLVF
jgi:hypothetical protein